MHALLVSLLLVGGTAYPVDDPVLTGNLLYRAGQMAEIDCPEKPVAPGNRELARKYVRSIVDCLNTAWADHMAEGRGADAPGGRRVRQPARGPVWGDVAAEHPGAVLPGRPPLRRPARPAPAGHAPRPEHLPAGLHEYAHHVQHMTGILWAEVNLPTSGQDEELERSRRIELQAECLAGCSWGARGNRCAGPTPTCGICGA